MDQRIGRQGGWGMVVLLVALAIVAWLYKDALRAYLLPLSPPTAAVNTGTPGAAARAAGASGIGPAEIEVSSAEVAPSTAIGRARGVEGMVKQGAEQRANRIDGTTP